LREKAAQRTQAQPAGQIAYAKRKQQQEEALRLERLERERSQSALESARMRRRVIPDGADNP
jgi:predicted kinase